MLMRALTPSRSPEARPTSYPLVPMPAFAPEICEAILFRRSVLLLVVPCPQSLAVLLGRRTPITRARPPRHTARLPDRRSLAPGRDSASAAERGRLPGKEGIELEK